MNQPRLASEEEKVHWTALITKNPDGGDFLQMRQFGEVKALSGWKPLHIIVDTMPLLVLERRIVGLGNFWYIQKGPSSVSSSLLAGLRTLAKSHKVFAIKLEPPLIKSDDEQARLMQLGLRPAGSAQPTYSTIWLDISANEEELLSGFSAKTRYDIRKAKAAQVTCTEVPATDENCQAFYDLFTETADGRFGIRPFAYYKKFWQSYSETGNGRLYFASHDDALISATFVMILGTRASRKDAASQRKKTVRGAAALLEYEIIRSLKEADITAYDLCGAPPSWEAKNQQHHLYGVGKFKSEFSETITDYVGAYELPISELKTRLWCQFVERLVRRSFRARGKSFY
jgi:lipid II:glycine glycyltransferase (peptidoglycan interpeptide bridge formation enzyme)